MTHSTQNNQYFDLHTSGIGYLNRIRNVTVRKGKPFLAVTIAALHGTTENIEYTYIDCTVVGTDAERLVRRCQDAVDANRKVLAAFRIGDIWTDTFTYDKGDRKGQTGVCLKGRLLFLSWIKVDGKTVYEARAKEEALPAELSESTSDQQSHEHAAA